jgi:hypothetical protein
LAHSAGASVIEGGEFRVNRADSVSSAFLLLLAICLVVHSLSLPFGSLSRPGPGFFPLVLSILLASCAGLLLVRSGLFRTDASIAIFRSRSGHAALAALAIAAYGAALEWIGFPLLTVALLLFLLRGLGHVSWTRSLMLAAAGTAIAFVLFRQLGVQLPLGLLSI